MAMVGLPTAQDQDQEQPALVGHLEAQEPLVEP